MTESERKKLIDRIMAQIGISGFDVLAPDAQELYDEVVASAGATALLQVGIAEDEVDLFNQVNEYASEFAAARGAELVGMKYTDTGELIENPNAEWAITDSTREMLRSQVGQAIDEGWSSKQLADAVKESYAFSDQRAEMIGRTEIARAQEEGTRAGWRASDVVESVTILLGSEHDEVEPQGDECDDFADGSPYPIDDVEMPPFHPACVCVAVANTKEDINA